MEQGEKNDGKGENGAGRGGTGGYREFGTTGAHILTSKLLDIAGLPAIALADVLPVYYF